MLVHFGLLFYFHQPNFVTLGVFQLESIDEFVHMLLSFFTFLRMISHFVNVSSWTKMMNPFHRFFTVIYQIPVRFRKILFLGTNGKLYLDILNKNRYYLTETEKSIKIAIRIRFDSIHSIFDSIRFGLLFEIHNSVRLDSTDSIFDSIRFDSTHPQQNIVFFVLCSTHYVRVQKRLSISP